MGGGDLNLKKSWHPSTLRNIERVWKAEQKHEVEQQKIEQLQKELAEERAREEIQTYAVDQGVIRKKDERLDWMYQGPAAMVNREEYLLGRKIDKTFETMQQMETGQTSKDKERDIGTTMFSSQDLTGTATVDLANKIREDPLFSIMKKEKEERKSLLKNPVKMKQLQQILEASLKSKKSKKSKKNKKKKHNESDSEEEVVQRKHKKRHEKEQSSDSAEEQLSSKHHRQHKTYESDLSRAERGRNHEDRGSYSNRQRSKRSHSIEEDATSYRKKSSKLAYEEHNSRDYDRREYRKTSPPQNRQNSSSSMRDSKYYEAREERMSKVEKKKKPSKEDRERLLREMQENARWRDEQRQKNTRRYREEDEKEDNFDRLAAADFVKPMLSSVAGKGSLENRVKQKIFSIQRNSGAMDKNFARRD